MFPLQLLAPAAEEVQLTETDIDTTVVAQPWLMRLFAATGSEHLGITRRSVGMGEVSYPALTAGAVPAMRARDQASAVAAWTAAAVQATPKRLAAAANLTAEDMIRLPGLEAAMVADLRAALIERADRTVLLGDATADGTDSDIDGLAGSTLAAAVDITQSAKASGFGAASVLASFASMLDGIHAHSPGDLRILMSVPAMTLWLSTKASGGGAAEKSIYEVLTESGFTMMRSRAAIDTDTANGDRGGWVGRAQGLPGSVVHTVWDAGEFAMTRDGASGARSGQLQLTVAMFHDLAIVRGSNVVPFNFVT